MSWHRWYRWLTPRPLMPWPPANWTKRDTADFVTFISTALGSVSAFAATQIDRTHGEFLLWLAFASGLVALFSKSSARRLEGEEKSQRDLDLRSRAARISEGLLEEMHRSQFRDGGDEDTHKNRVTLFVPEIYPAGDRERKRLAIFSRYGVYRSSRTTWELDEDHPDNCRGAVGKAWFHEMTVIKSAECDWPGDDGEPEKKKQYAESQGITVAEAESLHVKSRVVVACPVMVHGRRWGVLVLDSLTDEVVPSQGNSAQLGRFKAMFNHYASLIGRTVGEALS